MIIAVAVFYDHSTYVQHDLKVGKGMGRQHFFIDNTISIKS